MVTGAELDPAMRAALVTRLKIIEGQARGVQRMLESNRECLDILDQLSALRAATQAVTIQALETFALHCLRESPDSPEQVMTQFLGVVSRLARE